MAEIQIQRLGRCLAEIKIEGTAPLIMNKFSEKALQQMEDAQTGRAKVRQPKDPDALFESASHRLPDGRYGFPATGFKGAIVDAARYFKSSKLTMVGLKPAIFVKGIGPDMLVPIDGPEPKMHRAAVRNATGVADLRYRPIWETWSATLPLVYMEHMFDLSALIALVDAAGNGGIGEWRPASKESKTGMYGTWWVPDQDVKVVKL